MTERVVKIGLASFIKADSPNNGDRLEPQWGFGLMGDTVDVHSSDVKRFDSLNGPAAAPEVPLPVEPPVNRLASSEPPRAGRGSSAEAWFVYAESLGLVVDEGASRDEIIELVDESK